MAGKVVPVQDCEFGISCHSFNKDQTQIVLSPCSEELFIFSTEGSENTKEWKRTHVLSEHGGYVSMVDWCPEQNLIVSCGHDRNAYVWKYEAKEDTWKPTLVILRINRAATWVKWSPAGNKFAVASGSKVVPVCHFEQSNNWWISKMIKKHKSTVLSLAWCVNNKFVITGCSDFKCRVFSAYIAGIDPEEDDGFGEVWAKQHDFGTVLAEFDQAKAWVSAVAWAPNGFRLAFAGHGSTLHFVQILAGSDPVVQTLNCKDRPYLAIEFLTDDTVVGVGFDRDPHVFVAGGSEAEPVWSFHDNVDKKKEVKAVKKSGFAAAQSMFSDSVKKGISGGDKSTQISTIHQNTISDISVFSETKFTTSGIDGRVCYWDLSKISDFKKLG